MFPSNNNQTVATFGFANRTLRLTALESIPQPADQFSVLDDYCLADLGMGLTALDPDGIYNHTTEHKSTIIRELLSKIGINR